MEATLQTILEYIRDNNLVGATTKNKFGQVSVRSDELSNRIELELFRNWGDNIMLDITLQSSDKNIAVLNYIKSL